MPQVISNCVQVAIGLFFISSSPIFLITLTSTDQEDSNAMHCMAKTCDGWLTLYSHLEMLSWLCTLGLLLTELEIWFIDYLWTVTNAGCCYCVRSLLYWSCAVQVLCCWVWSSPSFQSLLGWTRRVRVASRPGCNNPSWGEYCGLSASCSDLWVWSLHLIYQSVSKSSQSKPMHFSVKAITEVQALRLADDNLYSI